MLIYLYLVTRGDPSERFSEKVTAGIYTRLVGVRGYSWEFEKYTEDYLILMNIIGDSLGVGM